MIVEHILHDLGAEYNLPQVNHQQLLALKHKSIKELLQMSGLKWVQVPGFLRKARQRFQAHAHRVHPISGMPEALHDLAERGYRMGILTSNTEEGVSLFLQQHKLPPFEFIRSSRNLFGKDRSLRHILKQQQLVADDLVMIGDELRDMVAAQKVEMESIGVTWGFNSASLLEQGQPTKIISNPEELLQLLP
ncbi:MAG: HAD-IA family hydrolase, partial [Bacteroidota bacterium]